ncbi:MAG: hypothetical protein J0H77_15280 [Alphaproteobacteria bacterium]|nr:hypothetical protein [Alphaproteobacteria bacterium]
MLGSTEQLVASAVGIGFIAGPKSFLQVSTVADADLPNTASSQQDELAALKTTFVNHGRPCLTKIVRLLIVKSLKNIDLKPVRGSA